MTRVRILGSQITIIARSLTTITDLDQSKMFFIIALGRSGSTLLQELMNTFHGFCNVTEARIGPERVSCYSYVDKHNDFTYLEQFIRDNWTKKYFVEKTPGSANCLPQLHERFPDANYIFLERNPLKIVLSQMNMFPPGEKDAVELARRVKLGLMDEKTLKKYNYERFKVRMVLKEIRNQQAHKHLFANQITIRYEELVKEPEKHLSMIASKFNILPSMTWAQQILARPSHSSRNNQYEIKALVDWKAIKMMREACNLWHYEYPKTSGKKIKSENKGRNDGPLRMLSGPNSSGA